MNWNWKEWVKAAGIRAIKTFAQAAIGAVGATALISEVDWAMVFGAAALAAILSLLTSLAGLPELQPVEGKHSIDPTDEYQVTANRRDDGDEEA